MDKIEMDVERMMEALERSGYLLESEISKMLAEGGYFVESNQVIQDAISGKSREIDLIAEANRTSLNQTTRRSAAKIKFVFEIKNNSAPLVLLTEYHKINNLFDVDALKEERTLPKGLNHQEVYASPFWEKLIMDRTRPLFTQYCSFIEKKRHTKNQLMAHHPDNLHEGLKKIAQYCEEKTSNLDGTVEENRLYLRRIYIPVVLISDDLFELSHNEKKKLELKEVDSSILVYNYHHKDVPKMAYVFLITKKGFPYFMESMLNIESDVEKAMGDGRNKGKKK